ncbi:hypothetical protein RHGRI_022108 [Rhododendron griersonianum]|uniref:SKP1-like protein n=1 Tax=Rhododendron griersonianum TaxID=479676 RepID=A0AAV6JRT6_9ERIC|nr:hypothetical protein RHGRI_022108 [Rhododendron griersonianum]
MSSSASSATKKKIVLKSSDGEAFEVEEDVALQSQTIKHMIEDDCADTGIPLPNVTSGVLSKVIEYCKKHAESPAPDDEDRAGNDALKTFDAKFIDVDQGLLFDLILAANYLDIKSLLDLTCQTVADMIKGKTPEEVRKIFNIVNDFTPEEEDELAIGRHEEERVNCLVEQLSVNGEYTSTFRTKSYIEMWKKAHDYHLGTKSLSRLCSFSSSSSSLPLRVSLCDLLEPRQETLADIIESSNLHPLVVNFFEATFAACNMCDLVLFSVDQARANYSRIRRVINLTRNKHTSLDYRGSSVSKIVIPMSQDCPSQTIVPVDFCDLRAAPNHTVERAISREAINCEDKESLASTDYTHAQCRALLVELASFTMLKNPLLSISPSQFRDIRDNHGYLLQKLTTKCRRVKRRAKFARLCKKTLGLSLMVSYSAIATAVLLLAIHSLVGILVAPPVVACSLGLTHHYWKKLFKRRLKTTSQERLGAQLEVAAKGVYILMNDFDTTSRLVRRLEDEIEHIRVVGDVCVRNGKMEVVKEVVKEFGIDQKRFLEQLKELEEQIILCFLSINRSRRLVMQEILVLQQENRSRKLLC